MRGFGQSHSRNLFWKFLLWVTGSVVKTRWFHGTDYRSPSKSVSNLSHLSRPASVLCHLFIVFPMPFLAYLAMYPFKLNIPGPNKHSAGILCRFTTWRPENPSQSQRKRSIFSLTCRKLNFPAAAQYNVCSVTDFTLKIPCRHGQWNSVRDCRCSFLVLSLQSNAMSVSYCSPAL